MAAVIAASGPVPAMTTRRVAMVVLLCAVVVLVENFDLAVMGLAAPAMMADLGLSRSGFGLAVSGAMFGFFIGAPSGGMMGDRFGRRRMLAVALGLLAVSSLATPHAPDLTTLIAIRFFTGLGVGLAFPNAIAVAASVVGPRHQSRAVASTTIGGALGGIVAGVVAAVGGSALPWPFLFYAAGVLPALLIIPSLTMLPADPPRAEREPALAGLSRLLFGEGRGWATLSLWVANFFTSYTVHLVLSWMPTMIVERGFDLSLAGLASILLNAVAMVGGFVFSGMLDRGRRRVVFLGIYFGMAAALAMMAGAQGLAMLMVGVGLTGLFLIGGQMGLYAVPAMMYPETGRSAGTGWALGIGRLGAILGPSLAGLAYDGGAGGEAILASTVPGLVIAGAAVIFALTLSMRARRT